MSKQKVETVFNIPVQNAPAFFEAFAKLLWESASPAARQNVADRAILSTAFTPEALEEIVKRVNESARAAVQDSVDGQVKFISERLRAETSKALQAVEEAGKEEIGRALAGVVEQLRDSVQERVRQALDTVPEQIVAAGVEQIRKNLMADMQSGGPLWTECYLAARKAIVEELKAQARMLPEDHLKKAFGARENGHAR